MAPNLESLFNAAELRLYVPRSEVPPVKTDEQPSSEAGPSRRPSWADLNYAEVDQRDRCFYGECDRLLKASRDSELTNLAVILPRVDEELEYFCQLDLDSNSAGTAGISSSRFSELVRQLDVSFSLQIPQAHSY